MLPLTSSAEMVRLSAVPAAGVVEAALSPKCVAAPTVTFAVAGELVAVHERHFALTM